MKFGTHWDATIAVALSRPTRVYEIFRKHRDTSKIICPKLKVLILQGVKEMWDTGTHFYRLKSI